MMSKSISHDCSLSHFCNDNTILGESDLLILAKSRALVKMFR